MNRVHDRRWEQLRAVEAELLSPAPDDPFQAFPKDWMRASELTESDWFKMSLVSNRTTPREPSPPRAAVVARRPVPRVGVAAAVVAPRGALLPMRLHERRIHRQLNMSRRRVRSPPPAHVENVAPAGAAIPAPMEDLRRRPLSPTQLPGVRAIPKDYNRFFRGLLTPGEYFAKSTSRYLGPFEAYPTEETLPSGDEYIILQRMGRLPDSGKSIFRQVGTLST